MMKSIKISEVNYDWLIQRASSPNKALEQLRQGRAGPNEISQLTKRVDKLEEFVNQKSGGQYG